MNPVAGVRGPDGKLSKTYRAWSAAKQRCLNPNKPSWDYYGGRGIRVCAAWMKFPAFYAAMGDAPLGFWLERINNDLGYTCGECDDCAIRGDVMNCKWATPLEQAANRRRTGAPANPDSLRQRAIRAGLDYHLVFNRIQWGWTEARALATPCKKRDTSKWKRVGRPRLRAPKITATERALAALESRKLDAVLASD